MRVLMFCVSVFFSLMNLSVLHTVWVGLLLCSQAGTTVSTSTSRCDATSSSSCCKHTFPPHSWWCCHGCRSGSTAGLCRPESPWVRNMSFEEIVHARGKSVCVCVKWWKLAVTWLHQLGARTCLCEHTNLPRSTLAFLLNYFLYRGCRCAVVKASLRSFYGSSHRSY